jgi:5'-nucleotidase, C-terminal domain
MKALSSSQRWGSRWAKAALVAALASGCGKTTNTGDGGTADSGSVSCEGVTGPCLLNEGSTMYEDVRVEETPIPSLAADVLLTEGKKISGQAIDVAFLNGGDFRSGLVDENFNFTDETARIGRKYQGPVTQLDLEGWFPYPEGMRIITLTGGQIRRALEAGVRSFADSAALSFGPDLNNDKGGWFLHVAGMTYEVTCPNTTRLIIGPPGCTFDPFTCSEQNTLAANSVSRIELGGTVILENGSWVGNGQTRTFRAILPDFIRQGLDGHIAFKEAPGGPGSDETEIPQSTWDLKKAVAKHVADNSPLRFPETSGRIVIKGEIGGIACNLPSTCLPAHKGHPNCAHLP